MLCPTVKQKKQTWLVQKLTANVLKVPVTKQYRAVKLRKDPDSRIGYILQFEYCGVMEKVLWQTDCAFKLFHTKAMFELLNAISSSSLFKIFV